MGLTSDLWDYTMHPGLFGLTCKVEGLGQVGTLYIVGGQQSVLEKETPLGPLASLRSCLSPLVVGQPR